MEKDQNQNPDPRHPPEALETWDEIPESTAATAGPFVTVQPSSPMSESEMIQMSRLMQSVSERIGMPAVFVGHGLDVRVHDGGGMVEAMRAVGAAMQNAADAMVIQAEAINDLIASNMDLIAAMDDSDEDGDREPPTYLDGSPVEPAPDPMDRGDRTAAGYRPRQGLGDPPGDD